MKGDDDICAWCGDPMVEHDHQQLARYCYPAQLDAYRKALAFAASCIKSGEPWTARCEEMIGGTLTKGNSGGLSAIQLAVAKECVAKIDSAIAD